MIYLVCFALGVMVGVCGLGLAGLLYVRHTRKKAERELLGGVFREEE